MKIKKFPLSGLAMIVIVLILLNSAMIATAVRSSLELCFSVIIPSLFPFMVMSSFFVGNMKNTLPGFVGRVLEYLFGFSFRGTGAFLCGLLCGYPIGARCASQLYREGKISKSEAETLLACANNSGPLFIIGAVGCQMLNSFKWGLMLWGVHIFCAIFFAIVLKSRTYVKAHKEFSFIKEKPLSESISESVVNILNVCGFVVFFSVINILVEPFAKLFPEKIQKLIFCFFEITNGINKVSHSGYFFNQKLYIIAFALGWSGLSVHMQVKNIVAGLGLSMKKYYFVRVMSAVISPFILFAVLDLKDNIFASVPIPVIKACVLTMVMPGLIITIIKIKKRKKVM